MGEIEAKSESTFDVRTTYQSLAIQTARALNVGTNFAGTLIP